MRLYQLIYICLPALLIACNTKQTLFFQIPSSHSGITFKNTIIENDSINPADVVNVYNGGGVGVGDFNNDGLQDIFFTGNMVACRLYLNKGDFKFDDVTAKAGVDDMGRWARGVSVIDINNDGLMDLYICNTIYKDSLKRRNVLYVNQGIDKQGIPHFKDLAAEYGLDVHVQSTMANFFDYDNDGDLDVYITVNEASNANNPSAFGKNAHTTTTPSMGRLFRNDMNAGLRHGVFSDVSQQAGITMYGFGHSATVTDINQDGWKDIYVSDDFISSNILYINNHDGTFTDRSKEYFKHTSFNAMGQDIIDINNDGLEDVFELDMNPPDNYRKKMMLSANSYITFQNFDRFGYQYQYVRNTLQLNLGPRVLENDSIGAPAFSEIGFMSGVAQTDWSWTPLITDFNNDGFRDIIVTNGFPKDLTDHDFIAYRREASTLVSKSDLLKKMAVVKLHNYAFKNKGDLTFGDVTDSWGLSTPTFSNGAAYADLDNDGDLDVIINNINDEASIYKNTLRTHGDSLSHYLNITLQGNQYNRNGIGAFLAVYYQGKQQVYENTPYRGYLSTSQNIAHFGLGKISVLDSVVVKWPGSLVQVLTNVNADQVLKIKMADAAIRREEPKQLISANSLFKEITNSLGINYKHNEYDFIDFNIQTTLPHKLSEYSPALAAGDVDGNGLDDLVVGGNNSSPAQVFLQQTNGKFLQQELSRQKDTISNSYKDAGLLLFDVNGDGSLDLYAASGGYEFASGSQNYSDRLYLNDGKGNFTRSKDALPQNFNSKLCVRAMDYNKDGKMDLFISGRVDPWKYPKPVSSFIYRNDSQNGKPKFTDVTSEIAPDLKDIGMVCDALFTDFDNDSQIDLILMGEWMPVTFLKNINGKFKNVTAGSGIANELGWWNSITAGDFRHTGRTDYIVGNVGLNTLYKASDDYPVYITASDFYNNGGYEAIPSLYLPDADGSLKEFPAHGRDDIIEKMPLMKKRFSDYRSFAVSSMNEILTIEQRKGALRLKANNLQSSYLRNDGAGKFTLIPLCKAAQMSILNGMVADDFDGDGNLDVLMNGNDYGTEVSIGRYDALNGLLLKGDGTGNFTPLSILQSGIYIPGNGKALVKLQSSKGGYMLAASQNRDKLKLFQLNRNVSSVRLQPNDISAIITFKNGKTEKQEFYYGSSFLSQSARFITIDQNIKNILITNNTGRVRSVIPN